MDLESFLESIIKNNHQHACWLNSLAYLEYRGFRKIIRSQRTSEISVDTLKHIQEEVRHSLILKNLAIKVGGEDFSSFTDKTMLSGTDFKNYFYNLDLAVSELNLENNYHAVTIAIEERALEVYQLYERLLRKNEAGISIQTIINDEEGHLKYFSDKLANSQLKIIEEKCFQDLLASIAL